MILTDKFMASALLLELVISPLNLTLEEVLAIVKVEPLLK